MLHPKRYYSQTKSTSTSQKAFLLHRGTAPIIFTHPRTLHDRYHMLVDTHYIAVLQIHEPYWFFVFVYSLIGHIKL